MAEEKEMQGAEAPAECTHNCSTCSANCGSKKNSLFEAINPMSMVGKVVGIQICKNKSQQAQDYYRVF